LDEKTRELFEENEALRRGVALLHRVANLLRRAVDRRGIRDAVLTGVTAGEGLGLNRAMLFLREGELLVGAGAVGPEDEVEADRVWRSILDDAADLETLYEAASSSALCDRVLETRFRADGPSVIARAFRDGALTRARPNEDPLFDVTGIAAPLHGPEGPIGVLYADNKFTRRTLHRVSAQLFEMIADHAGRALHNAMRFEAVQREARTDALTGLPHRRALGESLRRAVEDARDAPLGLVMIDVDDFKKINDTHGHPTGDAILAEVARRIEAVTRPGSAFRYGGEEFTLVLSGVDVEGAAAIAERVRHVIEAQPFAVGELRLEVTCSAGVASYPKDARDAEALLETADAALLRAKRAGKNRVEEPRDPFARIELEE